LLVLAALDVAALVQSLDDPAGRRHREHQVLGNVLDADVVAELALGERVQRLVGGQRQAGLRHRREHITPRALHEVVEDGVEALGDLGLRRFRWRSSCLHACKYYTPETVVTAPPGGWP